MRQVMACGSTSGSDSAAVSEALLIDDNQSLIDEARLIAQVRLDAAQRDYDRAVKKLAEARKELDELLN